MPRLKDWRYSSWADHTMQRLRDDRPPIVAVDTETTGLGFHDQAFCATLSWRCPRGELRRGYFDLEAPGAEDRAAQLGDVLRGVPAWVGHNAKFDCQKLLLAEVISWDDLRRVELHDTQTMFHLLDENSPKGLKKLAVSVLNYDDTIPVEVKSGPNKGTIKRVPKEEHRLAEARRKLKLKKEDGFHLLPRELLIPYALRDTDFTLQLYEVLGERLARKDEKLRAWYRTEMDAALVVLGMEEEGFNLDLVYLREAASRYGVRVMQGWQQIVALTGNENLNPNAPAQIKAAFAERGVRLDDTQAATLKRLDDDLARALLSYRSDSKIHTTYLQAMLAEHRDGRIHPHFNTVGPRTGRMSGGGAAG